VTDVLGQSLQTSLSVGAGSPLVNNTYTYDPATDRLVSILQTGSFVQAKSVIFAYQPDINALASITRYLGNAAQLVATSGYVLDARGLITNIDDVLASGATFNSYTLSYNANRQLFTSVSNTGTATYGYDTRNQLTSVTYTDPTMPAEAYIYDASGNMVSSQRITGTVIGTNNQITQTGQSVYNYDKEGNVTQRIDNAAHQVYDYTWDDRNRLTEVVMKDFSGNVVSTAAYTYDGLNRRVAEAIDGYYPSHTSTTRYFVYDGSAVLMEFLDPDGAAGAAAPAPAVAYLRGVTAGVILAQDGGSPGSVYWYLADQQGTVRDFITSAGALALHANIDAFGNILALSNTNTGLNHFFDGQEWDGAIGLYHLGARYYDPNLGRFMSQDPMGLAAGDSNLYRYAGNDPVNRADPTGMWSQPSQGPFEQATHDWATVDAEKEGNTAFWTSLLSFQTRKYDISTQKNDFGNFETVRSTSWDIGNAASFFAQKSWDFTVGFGSGLLNLYGQLLQTVADIGRMTYAWATGTKATYQSELFKLGQSVKEGKVGIMGAGLSLIAAPFIGVVQLGAAIFSGDARKAGELTAGTLPWPTSLGRLGVIGAKWGTIGLKAAVLEEAAGMLGKARSAGAGLLEAFQKEGVVGMAGATAHGGFGLISGLGGSLGRAFWESAAPWTHDEAGKLTGLIPGVFNGAKDLLNLTVGASARLAGHVLGNIAGEVRGLGGVSNWTGRGVAAAFGNGIRKTASESWTGLKNWVGDSIFNAARGDRSAIKQAGSDTIASKIMSEERFDKVVRHLCRSPGQERRRLGRGRQCTGGGYSSAGRGRRR
jgi:RHS repeat-associated protein